MELDVLDEGVINAPPDAVFRALIDQATGRAPSLVAARAGVRDSRQHTGEPGGSAH